MREQEEINQLLKDVIREAEAVRIPLGKIKRNVRVNARAKRRFGCCRSVQNAFGVRQFEIELSQKVLACEDKKIKEILAHELLHTCSGCQNHGKKWKIYATTMNHAYGYAITTTTSDAAMGLPETEARYRRESYRYILQCQGCGAMIRRKRASRLTQYPQRYRCAKCGGKLKIISQDAISSR